MRCAIVTRDRTVLVDDNLTIRQTMEYVSSRGYEFSLRRTFQLYGLRYVEERSFVSRYRQEFGLSDSKSMYDIKIKELRVYRDVLIGFPVKGSRV